MLNELSLDLKLTLKRLLKFLSRRIKFFVSGIYKLVLLPPGFVSKRFSRISRDELIRYIKKKYGINFELSLNSVPPLIENFIDKEYEK
ncbi:MAG: hypothetical protein QXG91_04675 [Candidatus Aenigmatarchaeota archaeon]